MNRIFQSVIWAFFFLSWLAGTAAAQTLLVANDQFGSGGLVLTDLGSGFDEALAIAVLADGRVVVAGSSDNGMDRDLAVVRYLPDGRIDSSFVFSAGSVIGAALGDDVARALTLLEDDSLILAGSITENGGTSAVLVKLLENGQLDYRFGDQGVVVYRPAGDDATFHDLHRLADGTLIAAGASAPANEPSPILVRFQADGSIDPAFGRDGLESFAQVRGELYGVAADAGGNLYGCGYSRDENGRSGVLLVRLSAASAAPIGGAFDETGVVTLFHDDEETIAHDIAIQEDGRLVIAGAARPAAGGSSVLVGRFAPDGTPDREVADDGLLVYDLGPNSAAYGIAVLADDTVLAAGYHQDESGRDLIVLQFDATLAPIGEPNTLDQAGSTSGALAISALIVEDGAFSPSAVAVGGTSRQATLLTTAVEGSDETGLAIVVDSGGTVFAAGTSGGTEQSAILVASYAAGAVGPGKAAAAATPVVSTFYAIETVPITAVTRVGALTGGQITALAFDSQRCLSACLEQCPDTAGVDDEGGAGEDQVPADGDDTPGSATTCQASCTEQCTVPTVEKRGVVYAVDPLPTYADGESEEPADPPDSDDAGGTTDDADDDGALPDNPFAIENFFAFEEYLVKRGQTEDGSGAGSYTSRIEDVNPQTVYYVRAYAVLTDGSVIYGNQLNFRTDDACFIATAAFGSVDGFAVQTLREFRDRYLQPYQWGRLLVSAYYRVSPPLADLVEAHLPIRLAVLWLLVPVVAMAILLVYIPTVLVFLPAPLLCWHFINRYLVRNVP
ncbi:delta-60 repeat domain-containing protein [Desulfofustis limnaeus]|uniref:Delta-60 repeat domain-containing protein n=1 Tax=Desulfofustis limnaeus TaxID=2740163 RepID=A0ABN6M4D1_9BACT|nr:delta-60 repeat domain-containing protein [Desulfofustis limnaeus]BDD86646.1 hypothetical protein DPPLL_10110 [Desulfofustis limnaeus]